MKMSDVFDFPVSTDDFSDAFYPNEDNQDEYAAHAINCHDELVAALSALILVMSEAYSLSDKAIEAEIVARAALSKARGEK